MIEYFFAMCDWFVVTVAGRMDEGGGEKGWPAATAAAAAAAAVVVATANGDDRGCIDLCA